MQVVTFVPTEGCLVIARILNYSQIRNCLLVITIHLVIFTLQTEFLSRVDGF